MSDIVHGEDIVVMQKIDEVFYEIGCATNCQFEFTNEIIAKTSRNSAGFREKKVRISDCKGSVSGLIKSSNANDVLSIFWFLGQGMTRVEATYKFLFTDEDGNDRSITMNAVIESIPLRGPVESFGEFDLNIEGTGGYELDSLDPPGSSSDNVDSDSWEISGGLTYIEDVRLENVTIIEVDLEGRQFEKVTGSPVGRQFKYTASIGGKGRIEFENGLPIDGNEVFVIWLY